MIYLLNDTAVSDKSPELLVPFPSLCSTCVCWLISLLHFHPPQGHSTLLFSCSEPWVTSSGLLCSLDFGWIWPVASTTRGMYSRGREGLRYLLPISSLLWAMFPGSGCIPSQPRLLPGSPPPWSDSHLSPGTVPFASLGLGC